MWCTLHHPYTVTADVSAPCLIPVGVQCSTITEHGNSLQRADVHCGLQDCYPSFLKLQIGNVCGQIRKQTLLPGVTTVAYGRFMNRTLVAQKMGDKARMCVCCLIVLVQMPSSIHSCLCTTSSSNRHSIVHGSRMTTLQRRRRTLMRSYHSSKHQEGVAAPREFNARAYSNLFRFKFVM